MRVHPVKWTDSFILLPSRKVRVCKSEMTQRMTRTQGGISLGTYSIEPDTRRIRLDTFRFGNQEYEFDRSL